MNLETVYETGLDLQLCHRDTYSMAGSGEDNGIYLLNESASYILRNINGMRSVYDIILNVAAFYGGDPDKMTSDVLRCLANMYSRGLIRVVGVKAARAQPITANAKKFSHMLLELTWDCNLRCKHCYMEGGRVRPARLDPRMLAALIRDFRQLGGRFLTLSGGEPMLYSGWDALAETAFREGLQLAIMTNGSFLDSSRMDVIRAFNMGVGLGLDGARAETHDANRGRGSFKDAMRALDLLEQQGYFFNTTVCFTALGTNIYDLPRLIDMMISRGLPRLYVSLLEERGRAKAFWDNLSLTETQKEWLLQYLYEASREAAGLVEIEVTHHTDIYSRLLYDIDTSNLDEAKLTVRVASEGEIFLSAYLGAPEHCMGRIGHEPLEEMLNSQRATQIIGQWNSRANRIPKCQACPYKPICKGGSPVLAYTSFGTFEQPDSYCDARIKLFDSIVAVQASQIDATQGETRC